MINEFKIGYYYKWIGNENKYYWYGDDVKLILNGKWYKCININSRYKDCIRFKGMKKGYYWDKKDFIESKYHPYVKKLLEEI